MSDARERAARASAFYSARPSGRAMPHTERVDAAVSTGGNQARSAGSTRPGSLSIRVDRFDAAHAAAVRAASNALFTSGGVALLLFVWCVFRPDSRWAWWLALGGSAAVITTWALGIPLGLYEASTSMFLLMPVYASYLWVFFESLRYFLLLRRRQRLGLADPVIMNRFLLFAIWTGGIGVITLMGVAGSFAQLMNGTFQDGGALGDPVVLGITRVLAVPIAASIFLTFLAPARYHAWLRAKAPEPAS